MNNGRVGSDESRNYKQREVERVKERKRGTGRDKGGGEGQGG